ncbi:sigma-54-dependent Fis family transcriptional regulator [Longimonas halophila]|uniref:Sigma-54-dependent Fis family transcriptional regulator n=1 Tax=Longimonas halophila TaxID=1469170 RepID=A0A2H3NYS5_9BACT|nr:sigma 54-interacting transcriptional regulator [Longimonas halophila]PEN05799.1 sigma-54-dependent Fis family transcriptional regulator [Longimonas halophila]
MDRASIQERFGIVGSSDAIKHVIDRARQVAPTAITVLLQGESGVGKELIAEVIHELSSRRHEDMVIVNCGAIPEGLIESELFGAEKGAYTGAVQQRNGYFEEADGGTIFLDEIGEMPKEAQVRLLRVLESGQFSRVGSSEPLYADVRVVAATNKNLATEVQEGRFRKDLYYRLSTVRIDIPPLRDRPKDIVPIFETYLHRFTQEYESRPKSITDAAKEALEGYNWPGNVRELRNVAEQCVVLLRGDTLSASDVNPLLRDLTSDAADGSASTKLMRISDANTSGSAGADVQERELLYRAILEMRMEMREMKDQLRALASNIGVVVPRRIAERTDFPQDYSDFVVMRNQDAPSSSADAPTPDKYQDEYSDDYDDYDSLIEDVVYEVEGDAADASSQSSPPASSPQHRTKASAERRSAEDTPPATSSRPAQQGSAALTDHPADAPLPTVQEAERQLIRKALRRFDGNRRKTAEALDISERTLYRKLKDMEDID